MSQLMINFKGFQHEKEDLMIFFNRIDMVESHSYYKPTFLDWVNK